MGLDIKFPIGLMFAIFGAILTVQGIFTLDATELYARSFGVNVNLWSGLFMLAFGFIMLILSFKKKKSA